MVFILFIIKLQGEILIWMLSSDTIVYNENNDIF